MSLHCSLPFLVCVWCAATTVPVSSIITMDSCSAPNMQATSFQTSRCVLVTQNQLMTRRTGQFSSCEGGMYTALPATATAPTKIRATSPTSMRIVFHCSISHRLELHYSTTHAARSELHPSYRANNTCKLSSKNPRLHYVRVMTVVQLHVHTLGAHDPMTLPSMCGHGQTSTKQTQTVKKLRSTRLSPPAGDP